MRRHWHGVVLALVVGLLVAACAGAKRPTPSADDPLIQPSPRLESSLLRFFELNLGEAIDGLAISGGGQNGAYGVGLIQGWRNIGIPRFDVVTGVSTGALTASHVFLDSAEADRVLAEFYTSVRQSDILCKRNVIHGLTSDAFADMAPLEALLERVIDDALIDRVAEASEGGKRLLLVGTVNLDTGGYRIWDLGAMARTGQYDKYRAVLRASAGPPAAVPPVYLEGGMHADGSTASSLFIPFRKGILTTADEAQLAAMAASRGVPAVTPGTLYLIVNGLKEPATERVPPKSLDIATRALDVMSYSLRLGNLWYIHNAVTDVGGSYRLRFIPASLRADAKDFLAFDKAKMRRIFDRGVRDGRDPAIWESEPPLLRPDRGPAATPGS